MPTTHLPEIVAETGARKPALVYDASHMQFGTEFFRYRFSITNRTLLYFHAGLWYCVLNMLTSIRRSTCTELCCVVFDFSCNVLFCYFFLCFGFFLLPLMANKVVCTSFLVRVFGADFWHVCHGH